MSPDELDTLEQQRRDAERIVGDDPRELAIDVLERDRKSVV